MAKKRTRQKKRKPDASPAPGPVAKGGFGKATLAWAALIVLVVAILAVLEMVKERLV